MTRNDLAPLGRLRPTRALLLGTAFTAFAATGAFAETLTVSGISPGGSDAVYGLNVPTVEIVDGNLWQDATARRMRGWCARLSRRRLLSPVSCPQRVGYDVSHLARST